MVNRIIALAARRRPGRAVGCRGRAAAETADTGETAQQEHSHWYVLSDPSSIFYI